MSQFKNQFVVMSKMSVRVNDVEKGKKKEKKKEEVQPTNVVGDMAELRGDYQQPIDIRELMKPIMGAFVDLIAAVSHGTVYMKPTPEAYGTNAATETTNNRKEDGKKKKKKTKTKTKTKKTYDVGKVGGKEATSVAHKTVTTTTPSESFDKALVDAVKRLYVKRPNVYRLASLQFKWKIIYAARNAYKARKSIHDVVKEMNLPFEWCIIAIPEKLRKYVLKNKCDMAANPTGDTLKQFARAQWVAMTTARQNDEKKKHAVLMSHLRCWDQLHGTKPGRRRRRQTSKTTQTSSAKADSNKEEKKKTKTKKTKTKKRDRDTSPHEKTKKKRKTMTAKTKSKTKMKTRKQRKKTGGDAARKKSSSANNDRPTSLEVGCVATTTAPPPPPSASNLLGEDAISDDADYDDSVGDGDYNDDDDDDDHPSFCIGDAPFSDAEDNDTIGHDAIQLAGERIAK